MERRDQVLLEKIDTKVSRDVERVNQRLEALRRSFDDDARCAPPQDTRTATEYLLLTLSGEVYAYPVACALEILGVPPIVPMPGVPADVLGIINFRGQILSVTRIHTLLGLTAGNPDPGSRIVATKGLPVVTGILVDGVENIAEVDDDDILPLPVTIGGQKARLLAGQIYVGDRVVFLLDMEQLFESESLRVTRTDPAN